MPVLPKHAIDPETFDKSTLKTPIGTGPYVVAEVSAPNYVVYKRNPDYWAKDLPIKRGFDNFDEIRVDYYRDANSMFEAFKKGLYQINPEGDPAQWNTAYDFPAVKDGRVIKETFKTGTPKGMSGFVFNTRRPMFADPAVRRALAELFDFEWVNHNLYYDAYVRAAGYFNDSELSSIGRPADEREKALLAPFPGVVAPDVMDGTYKPTASDGSGADRKVLRQALSELQAAGLRTRRAATSWSTRPTGQPLAFEILVTTKEDERLALAYQRTLDRIGIKATIRSVDAAQFQQRRQTFDFDMTRMTWPASLSPGNEQNFRWSQAAADSEGSFNSPGAKQPAIDAMIQAMLAAPTREDFVAAVRALDRVLISGYYVVPLFYLPETWIARWNTVEHPETTALTGPRLETWYSNTRIGPLAGVTPVRPPTVSAMVAPRVPSGFLGPLWSRVPSGVRSQRLARPRAEPRSPRATATSSGQRRRRAIRRWRRSRRSAKGRTTAPRIRRATATPRRYCRGSPIASAASVRLGPKR